jgi:hypothetical protein
MSLKRKNRRENEIRAIEILKEHPEGLTAKHFGLLMWPDNPKHKKVSNIGNGATHGVGMWFAAGSYLSRLEKRGVVRKGRGCDHGYYLK